MHPGGLDPRPEHNEMSVVQGCDSDTVGKLAETSKVSVKQPTNADLTKAKNIANNLEQTAATMTTASAIMGLATTLMTVYRKTPK